MLGKNAFKDKGMRKFLLKELNRFRNRAAIGKFKKENGLVIAARMATLVIIFFFAINEY